MNVVLGSSKLLAIIILDKNFDDVIICYTFGIGGIVQVVSESFISYSSAEMIKC